MDFSAIRKQATSAWSLHHAGHAADGNDPERERPLTDLPLLNLRAGQVLILVFQSLYLYLDRESAATPILFHLLNMLIGIASFAAISRPFGRRNWRVVGFVTVVGLIVSTLVISVAAQTSVDFYLCILLLTIGASALVPWEPGWQLLCNASGFAAVVIHTALVGDPNVGIHWLSALVAIGVAQSCSMLGEHYRREIGQARTAALQASEAKSGFLASMSHEIRTPLNAIIGFSEVLGDTSLTDEQRKYLSSMSANGRNLLDLINNILDLAKIEAGRLSLVAAEFDLPELAGQIVESLALAARAKNLKLALSIAPLVPRRVIGDALRIRQVLLNLLGNAVKFTEYGEVSLSIENRRVVNEISEIEFTVNDTGIGIPEEQIDAIFQNFTQLEPTSSRRHEGTGLGLAIVKRLVEMLGGAVSARSKLLEGSSFSVVLPLKAVPEMTTQPSIADSGVLRILVADSDLHETEEAGESNPAPSSVKAVSASLSHPAKILLVEDNPGNRALLRAFLQDSPVEIDEAENGALAISKFVSREYDLVLMDMFMPVVDGYEATRAIRKWEREQHAEHTPIVAVTAAALNEDRQRSIDSGCDFHLSKPISKAKLISTMEAAMAGRRPAKPATPNESFKGLHDLGDPAAETEIARLFVGEMERHLQSLKTAIGWDDVKTMREAVHAIKGSAAALGTSRIVDICAELSLAASLKAESRIRAALTSLEGEIANSRSALEKKAAPVFKNVA